MAFELHPNFSNKIFIADLPLCKVLMEDAKDYPWIFLIPMRANIRLISDLSIEEQAQLLREMSLSQEILQTHFNPDHFNIAAIGNMTPQLHIHVIGRFEKDPSWPGVVWDKAIKPYPQDQKNDFTQKLRSSFTAATL